MHVAHLILDANNLLHACRARGELGGDFALARQALVRRLEPLVGSAVGTLTVIFDGTVGGRDEALSGGAIDVRYADRDTSADTLIERTVRAAAAPADWMVVSNDHAIRRACEAAGAASMGCAPFLDWLADQLRLAARTRPAPRPPRPTLGDFFPPSA